MIPQSFDDAPLVFVYLGEKFPDYGLSSLGIVTRTTGNPIVVLGDGPAPKGLPSEVEWIRNETFYSGEEFRAFSLNPNFSAEFRDGFWLKTAERFFVLKAFMERHHPGAIFHGELDCLFMNLRLVESEIVATQLSGLFLPRETDSRCIASLVYINELGALKFVCQYLVDNAHLGNEMDILGSLQHHQDSPVHALPSAEFLYRAEPGRGEPVPWAVAPSQPSFIADGAVLGRWIFGVDPRNTGGRGTKNRIQNHKYGVPWDFPLADLTFELDPTKDWRVSVSKPDGESYWLAVIHVHSKIHQKLTALYFRRVLNRLRAGKATTIVAMEVRFPLEVAGRIARQVVISVRSADRLRASLRHLLSPAWWAGLKDRLTRL